MNHEAPRYEYDPDLDMRTRLPIQQETVEPIVRSPLAALGDLAVMAVLTGGGTAVMPHPEVLVLQSAVTATEVADRLAA